ncbi:MAG: hypothetical protein JWM21_4679 [Acidobacteria bacterium]|nr:hypothetical protein [Acidobacteriota bacterium]
MHCARRLAGALEFLEPESDPAIENLILLQVQENVVHAEGEFQRLSAQAGLPGAPLIRSPGLGD